MQAAIQSDSVYVRHLPYLEMPHLENLQQRDATLKGATLEDAQEEAEGLIGFELEKNFQVQNLKFRLPELELAAKLSLR